MCTVFNDVCVLVAAAFALTLVPGFRNLKRSLLSRRDQGAVLLVFIILGLVEETTVSHDGLLNERIVAVCAAGLVAGPWVGLIVGAFVTWLAVAHHGLPLGAITTSMLCGGLAGGWLCRWRPKLAQQPLTGFYLTFGVSSLRSGFLFVAPHSTATLPSLEEIGMAPVVQGLGTALILAIIDGVRDRDEQSRAAASAEARALQARMTPHFLFNALNTLAALSRIGSTRSPGCGGALTPISTGQFRSTRATPRNSGGRTSVSACLSRHRVAATR
jgi:LytS/YehU family sensor histidine kinase